MEKGTVVKSLAGRDKGKLLAVMQIGEGNIGELTQKLYDEITGIQWGRKADPFGWRMEV